METAFNFTLSDSEYMYNMNSNIKIIIKQNNSSVTILYFIDEMNNKKIFTIKNYRLIYTDNFVFKFPTNDFNEFVLVFSN